VNLPSPRVIAAIAVVFWCLYSWAGPPPTSHTESAPTGGGAGSRSARDLVVTTLRAEASSGAQAEGAHSIDSAFYLALYQWARGDAGAALVLLDKAINDGRPTENVHLLLPLYARCFGDATQTGPDAHAYSEEGEKRLRALMQDKGNEAEGLVKRASLLEARGRWLEMEVALTRISQTYRASAWEPWARWKLAERGAWGKSMALAAEGWRASPHRMLARRITKACASGLGRDEIMRRWMQMELHGAEVDALLDAEDSLLARYRLDKVKSAKGIREGLYGEQAKASRKHWEMFMGPEWIVHDNALLRCIRGMADSNTMRQRRETIWSYFEYLRANGVQVPKTLPVDKGVFMGSRDTPGAR